MNMPAVQAPQLPAHLQKYAGSTAISTEVMGGLSSGAVNKISIEGKRWKLIDTQGQEFPVEQFHLDVIIVGANPHVSKTYYATKWVPGQDSKQPDCSSDNGVGPAERSLRPQCGTCAACPQNAWGSLVNDLGNKTKACSDTKKIAVVLANNPTGAVYLLRVPADSLKNLAAAAKSMTQAKIGLERVVVRMTFEDVSHPKIVFTPSGYVDEQQNNAVDDLLDSDDVAEVLNLNEKSLNQNTPIAVPAQPVAIPQVAVPQPVAQGLPLQAPQFSPQPTQPAAPVFATPQPPPLAFNPAQTQLGAAAPVKRPRRTKTQMAAEAAAQQQPQASVQTVPAGGPGMPMFMTPPGAPTHPAVPQFVNQPANASMVFTSAPAVAMPPMPQFLQRTQDVPGAQPAAAAVPLQPQPTDSALDAMLEGAMRRQ